MTTQKRYSALPRTIKMRTSTTEDCEKMMWDYAQGCQRCRCTVCEGGWELGIIVHITWALRGSTYDTKGIMDEYDTKVIEQQC